MHFNKPLANSSIFAKFGDMLIHKQMENDFTISLFWSTKVNNGKVKVVNRLIQKKHAVAIILCNIREVSLSILQLFIIS